jgi:hypothetical protein
MIVRRSAQGPLLAPSGGAIFCSDNISNVHHRYGHPPFYATYSFGGDDILNFNIRMLRYR